MDIRKTRIEDYDQVYQLWLSCTGMGLNNVDDSLEGITRFLKRNPDTCFVAENQEMIVGVVLAGHDGRRGYIYHTAVHPSYQQKGIGSQLVKSVLKTLKKEKISKVALVVFNKNHHGNDFWEKQGFIKRQDLTYRNVSFIEMIRIDT